MVRLNTFGKAVSHLKNAGRFVSKTTSMRDNSSILRGGRGAGERKPAWISRRTRDSDRREGRLYRMVTRVAVSRTLGGYASDMSFPSIFRDLI